MSKLALIGVVALLLAGCGEKPQNLAGGKKPDTPGWQDVPKANVDPGWAAGDRKAWEDHLKVRAQRGQNDYARPGSKN
ncbi:MAG: hypothetical protein JNL30_10375 [Rubrivivax sp.]|nr:hypothetical protein [Rubrivivax sp.]